MTPVAALTGGTGFLGRAIAVALTEAGWQVRLLVRAAPLHPQLEGLPLQLVLGGLADQEALARLVSGARLVVHAAGLVKARHAAAFHAINAEGTRHLAEAVAAEPAAPPLLLISSLAARSPELSAYAASKRAGEEAVAAILGTGHPWAVLRPSAIYGPWDREGLAMLKLAAGRLAPAIRAPEPRIAMIHVRDAAAAVRALAMSDLRQQTYELGDARTDGYGWRELLSRIGAALGTAPRPVPVPDAALLAAGYLSDRLAELRGHAAIFGLGKAREILHRDWRIDPETQIPAAIWRPTIDLDTGMAETVAWWNGVNRRAA
ncbi:NAD-dependent epimerase/dehydratase family protein [Acidisoma sp. 7E03]